MSGKKLFFSILMLTVIFLFAGCSGKKEKIQLEALEKREALADGVSPCAPIDDVRKAGIPLSDEPFDIQRNEEKGLESVTYLIQDESFAFDLAGHEIKSGFFQFVNEKLSNITLDIPDRVAYEAVIAEMEAIYGEPAEEESEGAVMNIWEFQGDYPVRTAVIGRLVNGEIVSGSFQVSYIWFGTEN